MATLPTIYLMMRSNFILKKSFLLGAAQEFPGQVLPEGQLTVWENRGRLLHLLQPRVPFVQVSC